MQELPHKQMRGDLAPPLLLVGRVLTLDVELPLPDRAHGEARARVVCAQLLAQRGIGNSESYGPQFSKVIGAPPAPQQPSTGAFLARRAGSLRTVTARDG